MASGAAAHDFLVGSSVRKDVGFRNNERLSHARDSYAGARTGKRRWVLPPSATPGTAILRENRRRDGLGTDEFDLTRCTHKRLHPSKSHVPGTRFLPRPRVHTAMKLALTRRRLEVGLFRRPTTISDFFHRIRIREGPCPPLRRPSIHPRRVGEATVFLRDLLSPKTGETRSAVYLFTGTRVQKQPRGHVNIVFPYTRTHG